MFCPGTAPLARRDCPLVIGNVPVYMDSTHVTPAYILSLADELERKLRDARAPLKWRDEPPTTPRRRKTAHK
jgi:hypothetical protein